METETSGWTFRSENSSESGMAIRRGAPVTGLTVTTGSGSIRKECSPLWGFSLSMTLGLAGG